MKFEIKNRWSGEIMFTVEGEAFGVALSLYVQKNSGPYQRANLTDANLTDADLTRANLTDADLTVIRDDFWAVLSAAPKEVQGLRKAIVEGRIEGSQYEGECACLVGTIAKVADKHFEKLPVLKPHSSRAAERFFLAIHKGDTPETSQFSKYVLEWLDEWVKNISEAFVAK